jgi:hypothetical protein
MSEEQSTRPTLNIQDIANVVELLRLVTERGAWRANELSTVGQIYDRLTQFLEGAGVTFNAPNETETQ